MKKIIVVLCITLIMTGCLSRMEGQNEIVQEGEDNTELALIPFNISNEYYRTVLPYKEGEARGLILNNVDNRLDMDEMELGLMRIAQKYYSTENHFLQAGQYLTSETINSWLRRDNGEGVGLNPPPGAGEEDLAEQHRQTPKYLSHILEHNFLVKNDEDKIELGGIAIGLSLNQVHYYTVPQYGWPREQNLDVDTVIAKGKEYAATIVQRLRQMEELQDIPIVIGLFLSEPRDSIIPGSYVLETKVDANEQSIKKWNEIREEYVLFPSEKATANYYNDATKMANFRSDIGEYFSNYIGVIGTGYYINEQLHELKIEIPIQFFGKSEVIGFTQFVTGKIIDHFPPYISIEVYISSLDNPESIIVRKANEEEPFVHIYR